MPFFLTFGNGGEQGCLPCRAPWPSALLHASILQGWRGVVQRGRVQRGRAGRCTCTSPGGVVHMGGAATWGRGMEGGGVHVVGSPRNERAISCAL